MNKLNCNEMTCSGFSGIVQWGHETVAPPNFRLSEKFVSIKKIEQSIKYGAENPSPIAGNSATELNFFCKRI